jgi:hypothetical protein
VLTLSAVKSEMGIASSNTGDDADLLRVIRQVVARIRLRTERGIAWVTDNVEQAGSAVKIRVIGHGWRTGQVVRIAGSNCTPTLDGEKTITRVDEDHITIPSITLTDVPDGVFATIHPKSTKEVRAIGTDRMWVPEQITPFLSVEAIYDRQSDDSWDEVDSDDYEVVDDPTVQKAVQINRLEGSFVRGVQYPRRQYGLRERSKLTTIKIEVWAGAPVVPDDVVMAGLSMVNDLWERAGRGKDEASFSFEGTSRSVMSGDERREHLLSPDAILSSWTAR